LALLALAKRGEIPSMEQLWRALGGSVELEIYVHACIVAPQL